MSIPDMLPSPRTRGLQRTAPEFSQWLDLPEESFAEITDGTDAPTHHKLMIMLHLEGYSGNAIADEVQCNPGTVYKVLNSGWAKSIVQQYMEFSTQEFSALQKLSVKAVRDGLLNEDINVRLKSADMFMKAHGKYAGGEKGKDTAEDIIQRIMEMDDGTTKIKVTETKMKGGV